MFPVLFPVLVLVLVLFPVLTLTGQWMAAAFKGFQPGHKVAVKAELTWFLKACRRFQAVRT